MVFPVWSAIPNVNMNVLSSKGYHMKIVCSSCSVVLPIPKELWSSSGHVKASCSVSCVPNLRSWAPLYTGLCPVADACLWVCLSFPLDRFSRWSSCSPSSVNAVSIFLARLKWCCLPVEHFGGEGPGRYSIAGAHKKVFVNTVLDLSTWPLLSFVHLFQSLQCDPQENSASGLKALSRPKHPVV